MPEDDYHLVDLYDSCEDPELRSEFLDSFGITRPTSTACGVGATPNVRSPGPPVTPLRPLTE
ncbi:hypothetical protein GA0115239_106013 [Streptomyces sp. BpilaLS-43]|uniref:hypothetical protein n=1 Tax=Streptomyces sp. BpilaLS-43 TaxID=1839778 RepID=UPI00081BA37D|nr:hypothetical protein [Streptomyces sp. BpilaLS-43]SCD69891.1 hypothetical protein GA0115239_106013 [Streptomyces sp. BpilaLS-43]